MRVLLVCVGKLKEDYLRRAEAEYIKRLRSYCKLEIIEAKSETALLAQVPADAYVVAFDERGKTPSSQEFAKELIEERRIYGGGKPLVLAVGGADGHSDAVRKRANTVISFGRLTIAHRLVRLLVLEQLYRGFRIVSGQPYHRE